ncbi:MAG: hypothetical protein FD168_2554 [Desulfobulbaceae bacterium]|nr:MAG: hypothetical protein FD168_2554 [Desulfobulbaceae bacterium]
MSINKKHRRKNIRPVQARSHAPNASSTNNSNEIKEKIEIDSLVFSISYLGDGKKDDKKETLLEDAKKLHNIGHDFTTVLQMLWKYINSIGMLAQSTSNTSMATIFLLLNEISNTERKESGKHIAEISLKLSGKDTNGEEKVENKKIKIFNKEHLSKIIEFNNHNQAASTILHETAIQQLVNAWEKLLADLINWFYCKNPDKISDKKNITFNKLLQITDLDELKQTIIDSEIKSFIGENTTQEQIKFFDDTFKTNFNSSYKKFDQLILLRHISTVNILK